MLVVKHVHILLLFDLSFLHFLVLKCYVHLSFFWQHEWASFILVLYQITSWFYLLKSSNSTCTLDPSVKYVLYSTIVWILLSNLINMNEVFCKRKFCPSYFLSSKQHSVINIYLVIFINLAKGAKFKFLRETVLLQN